MKPDHKAVAKLRYREIPRNKTGSEQQQAFNEIKNALIEATALAHPDSEGEFVLDTDAVAISGILHQ